MHRLRVASPDEVFLLGMNIEQQVPLSKATSLHVGGTADYFIRVHNDAEVADALRFAHARALPFFILGQGSNTLFPDDGFRGVVIHMEDRSLSVANTTIHASSGVFMRQLVNFCLDHELRGLEELAGIPGTVGGAVRGNAGTWQTEIKDVVTRVEILDYAPTSGSVRKKSMLAAECGFGYRHSNFKTNRNLIVVRASFVLVRGSAVEGRAIVAQDLRQRHERQPYTAPSAGSIFKNPDKEQGVFAGALIEQSGLKGTRRGGAEISAKHANFILNRGQATSADIQELITLAQRTVKATWGIALNPEIEIVPPQSLPTTTSAVSLDKP